MYLFMSLTMSSLIRGSFKKTLNKYYHLITLKTISLTQDYSPARSQHLKQQIFELNLPTSFPLLFSKYCSYLFSNLSFAGKAILSFNILKHKIRKKLDGKGGIEWTTYRMHFNWQKCIYIYQCFQIDCVTSRIVSEW